MLIDYKILYQDNMTSYYLSETFKTEQETEKYIEDILEDESRLFYSVEKVRLTILPSVETLKELSQVKQYLKGV